MIPPETVAKWEHYKEHKIWQLFALTSKHIR